MPNYRRAVVPGGTFFFTVVTHQRRPFLTTPLARRCLRESFREVRSSRPFSIDAIVLLPDHIHTVWTLPRGDADFSNRWNRIKAGFTQMYLDAGGGDSVVSVSRVKRGERGIWQRRFYEHTIDNAEDLKHCVDYIHINPLKHRLVDRVRDWPWSSFHRYVRLGEYDNNWGKVDVSFGEEWQKFE